MPPLLPSMSMGHRQGILSTDLNNSMWDERLESCTSWQVLLGIWSLPASQKFSRKPLLSLSQGCSRTNSSQPLTWRVGMGQGSRGGDSRMGVGMSTSWDAEQGAAPQTWGLPTSGTAVTW